MKNRTGKWLLAMKMLREPRQGGANVGFQFLSTFEQSFIFLGIFEILSNLGY